MANYIQPVVAWLLASLRDPATGIGPKLTAASLDPFAEYRQSWTWANAAWPPLAVLAKTTEFDPNAENHYHEIHSLTVKFGVQAADTEQLSQDAQAYMRIVSGAIDAMDWSAIGGGVQVGMVFVQSHDYGPLWLRDDKGGWAKFPELHLQVETREAM